MLMLISSLMFFSGVFSFCLKRKHLLLMLLSLEFITLSLFFNLIVFFSWFQFEYYFLMIYLSMGVCEGALGLAILVSMVRTHGNDYFQTFNLLW